MILGIILFFVGGGLYLLSRFGIPLGNLPGDIVIRRGNFTLVIPIVTSIVISILLTVGLNLLIRFLNR
jgi:hypothetical protein